jgi:hypothetical protein
MNGLIGIDECQSSCIVVCVQVVSSCCGFMMSDGAPARLHDVTRLHPKDLSVCPPLA